MSAKKNSTYKMLTILAIIGFGYLSPRMHYKYATVLVTCRPLNLSTFPQSNNREPLYSRPVTTA